MVGGGLLQPNSSFSLCQGQRVNARLRVLFFMRRVTGEFCSLGLSPLTSFSCVLERVKQELDDSNYVLSVIIIMSLYL